jgi:hypothetical protein
MKTLFYLIVSLLMLGCNSDDVTQQSGEEKLFKAVGTWAYEQNGNIVTLDATSTFQDFKKWLEINSNLTDITVSLAEGEPFIEDYDGLMRITCMLYARANPDNDPTETSNDYKLSFENLNGGVFFIGNIKDLKSLNLSGLRMPGWDAELSNNGEGGLAKQVIDNYPGLKYWNSSNNQRQTDISEYGWGNSSDVNTVNDPNFYKNQISNLCIGNGGSATF